MNVVKCRNKLKYVVLYCKYFRKPIPVWYIIEKEKTKAALFAILTPAQRVKADELRTNFESKMKERFDQEGNGFGKRGHREDGFPPMF